MNGTTDMVSVEMSERGDVWSPHETSAAVALPAHFMEWKSKVWGRTRCVLHGSNFEVHELEAKKGGFCSLHQHRKWNMFHLTSGRMRIELTGEHKILEAGEQFRVPPETWHRFVALEDCKLLEVYWTENIDPNDIVRADEGGILEL